MARQARGHGLPPGRQGLIVTARFNAPVIEVAPAYQEVNAIFQRELRLCFDGQRSVKDAAETMKREIDPLLKQYA